MEKLEGLRRRRAWGWPGRRAQRPWPEHSASLHRRAPLVTFRTKGPSVASTYSLMAWHDPWGEEARQGHAWAPLGP